MHKSVLLDECIENLNLKEDSIVVDCTLGYAGHSSEILKRINKGKLFAFDQDTEAILNSKKRLDEIKQELSSPPTYRAGLSTFNKISSRVIILPPKCAKEYYSLIIVNMSIKSVTFGLFLLWHNSKCAQHLPF